MNHTAQQKSSKMICIHFPGNKSNESFVIFVCLFFVVVISACEKPQFSMVWDTKCPYTFPVIMLTE